MAVAAELVDPGGAQPSWIEDITSPAARPHVGRRRPVAGLAKHPRLAGNQRAVRRQL